MKYDDFGYRFSAGELTGSEDLCLAGAWWERTCMETLSQGAFSACGVVSICTVGDHLRMRMVMKSK